MVTRLDRPLRRGVTIQREDWVVTISPQGLKLTRKGRRNGIELSWRDVTSGDAALAVALSASLAPAKKKRGPRHIVKD
ncbi:MAG TPA: hypothetical protein VM509_02160 [Planctomycetota bacterium]|nr:hypothetical protein [Planctomycetota bacterium]